MSPVLVPIAKSKTYATLTVQYVAAAVDKQTNHEIPEVMIHFTQIIMRSLGNASVMNESGYCAPETFKCEVKAALC